MSDRHVSAKDGPGEKMNDENWPRWKRVMEAFLFLKGCDEWLHSALPTTASDDEKRQARQARSWIEMCVSDRWACRIEEMDEPHLVWEYFEEYHRSSPTLLRYSGACLLRNSR